MDYAEWGISDSKDFIFCIYFYSGMENEKLYIPKPNNGCQRLGFRRVWPQGRRGEFWEIFLFLCYFAVCFSGLIQLYPIKSVCIYTYTFNKIWLLKRQLLSLKTSILPFKKTVLKDSLCVPKMGMAFIWVSLFSYLADVLCALAA